MGKDVWRLPDENYVARYSTTVFKHLIASHLNNMHI